MPYAEVERARLYYEDTGGQGTPVVLVHGAAGSSACWEQQVPAFTAVGLRVITYDLRGFGRSETDSGHESDGSIAADLEALVEHLALPSLYLVAQAYGGFGALEFAIDQPDQLRAVVVSTSFGGLTEPEFTALRGRYVDPDVSRRPVEERELGATYRRKNPEGVRRFLAMEAASSYRPAGSRQELGQPTTFARLESISVPTLLVAGAEDVLAPPPIMRSIADHVPGSRFEVIEGAGHCAYWEQPDAWNALILDFLRQYS
jgi:pimeloyl-ACP methyl ester carboxylesterase